MTLRRKKVPYNFQSENKQLNPSELDVSKLNLNGEMNIQLTPEMVAFLRTNLAPIVNLQQGQPPNHVSGYRMFSDIGVNREMDGGSSMDYGFKSMGSFQDRQQEGRFNPYVSMNNPLPLPVEHYVRRDAPGISQGRDNMQNMSYSDMMPGKVAVGTRLPVFNDAGVGMLNAEYNRSDKPQSGGPSMDELRLNFEQAVKNGTINAYVSRLRNLIGEEGQNFNATSAGANMEFRNPAGPNSSLSVGGRYDRSSMDSKPSLNFQVLLKKMF